MAEKPAVALDSGDDLSFEMAFNESVGKAQPEEVPVEAPAEEAEEAAEEVAEAPVEEPAVEEPPKEEAPVVDPRIAKLEDDYRTLAEQVKPKPAEVKPEAPKEEPLLSDEEAAFLDEYRKEWPDADRAFALYKKQIKAEAAKELQALLENAVGGLKSEISPFIKVAQETEQERFVRTVTTEHPDAVELLPKVEQWVGTLPPALKTAYGSVIENGTAADVITLFSHYKQMTGTPAPAPKAAPKAQPDPVKEAKLKKMEGVRTERTAVTTEPDPYDFSSAFQQATKGR